MQKIIKLSAISMSVLFLASCSTLGIGGSDNADVSSSDSATTSKDASQSTEVSAPTAKISLKKLGDDKIKAVIYTTYNGNPQGSVKLQWQAPEGTKCNDTIFPITKYSEENDMTWATVNVKQGSDYCSGTWTANVVYNKDVIASDSITV